MAVDTRVRLATYVGAMDCPNYSGYKLHPFSYTAFQLPNPSSNKTLRKPYTSTMSCGGYHGVTRSKITTRRTTLNQLDGELEWSFSHLACRTQHCTVRRNSNYAS